MAFLQATASRLLLDDARAGGSCHLDLPAGATEGYLLRAFGWNVLPAAQVMVHALLERERFTVSEAHVGLEDALGRECRSGCWISC